jgi:hypothetical protein
MLETIQNFESAVGPAARDYPLYVIAPGSAAVAVGLLVWLGGFGIRRVLMGIVGAAGGFALGYFVIGRGEILPAAIVAGVAAIFAALLDRVLIAHFVALLAAGIGFAVLIGPHMSVENVQIESNAWDATAESQESAEQLNAYLLEMGETLKGVFSEVPVYKWAILVLITLIFFGIGFIFRRLAGAAFFSGLGTLLIGVGLAALLLYKGAAPLSRVGEKPWMYVGIIAGMAAFGTIVQLLFCRGGVMKPVKKENVEEDDDETGNMKRLTD